MRTIAYVIIAASAAASWGCGAPAGAQKDAAGSTDSAAGAAAGAVAATSDTVSVEDDARAALTRMGSYLRTLKSFEVKGVATREEVLDDGQKVQISGRVSALAERPSHLRVQLASDRKQRIYIFDGTTFTLFAPRQNFYASFAAPKTIGELATLLEEKYAIDLPFVDLFRWGTPDAQGGAFTSARYLGPSEVDGVATQQYAFRQAGVDWQIWIQNGESPLPRKLVITTTTDDARPQYEAVYTWDLTPSIDNSAFTFTPPKDARRITIAEANNIRRQTAKGGTGK